MPDLLIHAIAWFTAWLFGVAALHKFQHPAHYRSLMGAYLNREPLGGAPVVLVATAELLLGVALLLPFSRRAALAAAALMLLAYGGLMALQLARGRADLKCGCAGPASDATVSAGLVLRNLICAGAALLALGPETLVAAGVTGYALSLFIAAFAVLFYLGCEQLIVNAQQMAGER